MPAVELHGLDLAVIGLYILFTLGLGVMLSRKTHNAEDYFLAGRGMVWPFIGISLFASNISSTTLVGLAGDAYSTGISVFNYEWMAAVVLVFFAIFLLPFVLRARVFTMPEFLERRFDRRARTYFAGLLPCRKPRSRISRLVCQLSLSVGCAAGADGGAGGGFLVIGAA